MLLFTRIASVGYLFNICYSGATQWILNLTFSAFMVILTIYSCYVTIRLRRKHDNKIQYYQHMAYAQGMGRSSIIFISFLLSVDYGFRVGTYTESAAQVVRSLLCRLDYAWFNENFHTVKSMTGYIIPIVFFLIAMPLAFYTKISELKYYARILFFITIGIFLLSLIAMLVDPGIDKKDAGGCISLIYYLTPMKMQAQQMLDIIPALTQIPNISAQYNLDTFLLQF